MTSTPAEERGRATTVTEATAAAVPTRTEIRDTVRFLGEVIVPTLAGGVLKRRPRLLALAERLRADRHAVRLLRGLRTRYGPGPLRLRIPGRSIAVLLDPEDVGRVLRRTPAPFTPAAREKQAALRHFQPHAVLATPNPERAPRRRFNELILENDQELHTLAPRVRAVVREETDRLLSGRTLLSWDAFEVAWWRIVRRIVLGDHARDLSQVTDELAALRLRGNWAFLLPEAGRRRERFRTVLGAHLARAEPGSLAGLIAERPAEHGVDPHGQVPHWLFAFDAAGMVTLRTLAVLATDTRQAERARDDVAGGTADGGPPPDYLRACVLETVRLWPTTPILLRESTTATSWRGVQLAPGTLFVTFTPFFHRAPELVPFADGFSPEAWLDDHGRHDGAAEHYPGLVPFSAGPGGCPGRNLVLLVTSTMLSEFLRRGTYRLLAPKSLAARRHTSDPMPATVNHTGIRLAVNPVTTAGQTRESSP